MNKELIFNEVIENILNTITLARVEKSVLINKNAEIWIDTLEGKQVYLNYIPYESEGIDIHGNTRISLAKEFVKTYSFNQLKELYNNKIEAENNRLASEENNKYKLENAIKELELHRFNNFTDDDIEVKFFYNVKKYYIEFNINANIKVCNNDSYDNLIYKIDHVEYNYNSFKIALEGLYDTCKARYEAKQEEQRKELEEIKSANKIKDTIYFLYKNVADKIVILKTGKKTFTAFENGVRYSVGTGKSGKFYRCDYIKFEQFITKKGAEKVSYCLLDKSVKTYQDDNFYLNLEYRNII